MYFSNCFVCLSCYLVLLMDYKTVVGNMADEASDYLTQSHDPPNDLTTITWAHAVNSRALLEETLKGPKNMIEADIVLGHIEGDTAGILIPIMAHPPNTVSDLSLADFLDIIRNSSTLKGVKLDFKSREAFSASENILEAGVAKQPDLFLWLNADIMPGPVNATSKPVDADYFLSACVAKFPEAVLSVGWTTNYGGIITEGSYTPDQISNMTEALNRNQVIQPVTFAVRAGLAAQSFDSLSNLIASSVAGTTLTIWCSSDNDYVNIADLRKLVNHIGRDKIYLDLPEDMTKNLQSCSPMVSGVILPVVLCLLSLMFML